MMNEIILKIKEKAVKEKITAYKIGKLTGFPPNQIANWFNGNVEPSISNAQRLAEALSMEIKLVEPKKSDK